MTDMQKRSEMSHRGEANGAEDDHKSKSIYDRWRNDGAFDSKPLPPLPESLRAALERLHGHKLSDEMFTDDEEEKEKPEEK
jgi:hypothetical protein